MGRLNTGIKPQKPYPDFPLTPHNSGKWAKKIKGKLHYFGRWDDAYGALREFNAVKDDLLAGRTPTLASPTSITVRDLCNLYLARQKDRMSAGKIEPTTYTDLHSALLDFAKIVGPDRLVADLRPTDFATCRQVMSKGRGPHTISRRVANVRAAFNYGERNGLLSGAVAFGDHFAKEPVKEHRRSAREAKYKRGAKMFTPAHVKKILRGARPPLKAMILLGINAGFYAIDVARLPIPALDLDRRWIEFPRTKTEVMRVAPLWPETVTAIRAALKVRGQPRNPADGNLVFVTSHGNAWVHVSTGAGDDGKFKAAKTDAVNLMFKRLLEKLGIRRRGVGFGALRHTFRTIADDLGDSNAANMIMGHAFPGMEAFYVQGVNRKRLLRVVNHVRKKLL